MLPVRPTDHTHLPLFAYGRLGDQTFLGHLLERAVAGVEARLADHAIVAVGSSDVVVPRPGQWVDGRLYRHLTADDYERLDAYRGVGEGLYERRVGGVQTPTGDGEPAFFYEPTERTVGRVRRASTPLGA